MGIEFYSKIKLSAIQKIMILDTRWRYSVYKKSSSEIKIYRTVYVCHVQDI